MKHLQKIIPICVLALMLVICVTLLTPKTHAATQSDLTFTLNDDGNGYTVSACDKFVSGELVIPATYNGKPVTSIGDYAFSDCSRLTSITIPDGVTSIAYRAFYYCSSLTSIVIPDSVTSIGDQAFIFCASLTGITIPDGVTFIGYRVFSQCDSLTGIWVDAENTYYSNDDKGVLFNKDKTLLIAVPNAIKGHYTIPDSITAIDKYMFSDCSSLTSITIPDSITSISDWTFYKCKSLTSVDLPKNITYIGNVAFGYCEALKNVTLPDNLQHIGLQAFYRCEKMEKIVIPGSVTNFSGNVFDSCSNLESAVIMEGVTDIAYATFAYTGLQSIAIPESVTSIGFCAFDGSSSLQDVYYAGSETQWKNINVRSGNEYLLNANIHFNHVHNFVNGICAECMIPGGSDQPQGVPGDLTGDNQTNNEDVVLLLWHTLFPEDYPLTVNGDLNGDNAVNNDDVVLLLWHTLFPEEYPL